jgi:hypothetical protein
MDNSTELVFTIRYISLYKFYYIYMISITICRTCRNKKWKILGLISAVICFTLCIVLTTILLKYFHRKFIFEYYKLIYSQNFLIASISVSNPNITKMTSSKTYGKRIFLFDLLLLCYYLV